MTHFLPTIESLNTHQVPSWFHDAKFGIFIHWGMSSIPAFAPTDDDFDDGFEGNLRLFEQSPYAEWYQNSLRIPGSRTARHHAETYGADTPYDAFRGAFEEDLMKAEPREWAQLAKRAGAKYLVQVTKHHDGYCLWPTDHDNPRKTGWHASRDIIGETAAAVRAEGLRYGTYYSAGLDWTFSDQPLGNFAELILGIPEVSDYLPYAEHHMRELMERVKPDVLWNDIGYPMGGSLWQLMADYYNSTPDGLINDRWQQPGAMREMLQDPATYQAIVDAANQAQKDGGDGFEPPLPPHCDFRTPEYKQYDEIQEKKWESTRGIGKSFGFRRNEPADDILKLDDLVTSFVDIVSKNGNLLLNMGPMSDGTVPGYQVALLEDMGRWLEVNGEGIFATRPWQRAEGTTSTGLPVRFTQKEGTVYAFILGQPDGDFTIEGLDVQAARWLGGVRTEGSTLTLPRGLNSAPAYGIALEL